MSNNEAKFRLNAYRPSGADATDPSFSEALAQAKADPALGEWFAREQAHARAVAAKLSAIAPPAGLRDAILAGGRATEQASTPAPARRSWNWMAIAASIAVLTGAGFLALRPRLADHPAAAASSVASVGTLTRFALADAADESKHGGHGAPEKALQHELGNASLRVAGDLPVDFAKLALTGCRTLRVAHHDVLEVCFARNGLVFHLYVAPAAAFDAGNPPANPTFIQQGQLAAATWSRDALRYVVVAEANVDAVKAIL